MCDLILGSTPPPHNSGNLVLFSNVNVLRIWQKNTDDENGCNGNDGNFDDNDDKTDQNIARIANAVQCHS